MEKECYNCKYSIEPDGGQMDTMCDICENKSEWQELKENEK